MSLIAQKRQQTKSTNKLPEDYKPIQEIAIRRKDYKKTVSRCIDCGKFLIISYKIGLLKFCRDCYEKNIRDLRKRY